MKFLNISASEEVEKFSSEEKICGISSSDNRVIIVSTFLDFIFVYDATDKQILTKKVQLSSIIENAKSCVILSTDSTLTIYPIYQNKVYSVTISLPIDANTPVISEYDIAGLHDGVISPFTSELILLQNDTITNLNGTLLTSISLPYYDNALFAIEQGDSLELYTLSSQSSSVEMTKIVDFVVTKTQSFTVPGYFQVKNTKIIENQYFWIPGDMSILISRNLEQVTLDFEYYDYRIAFFRQAESKVMLTKSGSEAFFYDYLISGGKLSLDNLVGEYSFCCNPGEIDEIKVGNQYYFYDQNTLFHESRTINANQTDPQLFYPSDWSQEYLSLTKFYPVNNQTALWYNYEYESGTKYRLAKIQIAEGDYNPLYPDDTDNYYPLSTTDWLLILSCVVALLLVVLVIMIIWTCRKLRRRQEQVSNISQQQFSKQRVQLTLAHPNISF